MPGSQGPRRDLRISVGLREGWYAEGRVFDVSEAVRTTRAWMKRRVESRQPALSGMFTRAEVTYVWPRDDGTVGSDREPVALFTGKAIHAYLSHLPDAAIEAMLNELATELGGAWAGAHLCRVRRTDVDFGCRRASRVTRGPGCWRRLHVVTGRRVFVCRADGNLDSMRSIARPTRHLDGVYTLR